MTPTELCEILTYARDKRLSLGSLHTLAYLHQHGSATMTTVARHIGISGTGVTNIADTLSSLGYLTRSHKTGDRREICLQLTGMGERVITTALLGPNPALV
jgi:DNA-binding MarR family transcriptional regulator